MLKNKKLIKNVEKSVKNIIIIVLGEDDMENSNELVIWKKKFGYSILVVVFIASVIGSNLYFSMLKRDLAASEINKDILVSGDVLENFSGDLFVSGESNFSGDVQAGIIDSNDITNGDSEISKNEQSDENKSENPENVNDDKKDNENNVNYFVSNRKLDPNKPMVALTFDDGPDPVRTAKLLEILKKNNSVATFFDIGELMDKYPEIVKKEIEAGCEVGGHTYSHVNLNTLSREKIEEEITKVENAYKNATGLTLKYIRPTYGNANKTVREVVKHPLINWCVDSLDWSHRNAEKVIAEINNTKNFNGAIILMHVNYDSTVKAMEKFIPELISKGYQLVTISEMAEYKGYTLENGKIYYQF